MKIVSFDSTLNRLRSLGTLEAISSILLFFVAMPLKYIWDWPHAIRPVGMTHGILWMAYVGFALLGQVDYKWSWKITGWLFLASLIPFGPFVADAKLLNQVKTMKECPV